MCVCTDGRRADGKPTTRRCAHPHRPSAHPPVSTPARQLPAAFLSAAGTIVFVSMLHGGVNHDKTDARTRTPHAGAAVIVVIHQWHPIVMKFIAYFHHRRRRRLDIVRFEGSEVVEGHASDFRFIRSYILILDFRLVLFFYYYNFYL